ncbi:MAG: hypothetical protein Q9186_007654 [Xanthomendoza sp. 1 TL-2023]
MAKSSPELQIAPNILHFPLQYGTGRRIPPLYSYLRQFTMENMHPKAWDVSRVSASQRIFDSCQTPACSKAHLDRCAKLQQADIITLSSPPIFQSTDGLVVRLNTFSKTVAPGYRLGWITTQTAICDRFLRITESSTQQLSGCMQSIIAEKILGPHDSSGRGAGKDDEGWKTDGWIRWLEGLRGDYERRMQTMCNIFGEGKQLVKTGRRQSMSDEWSVIDTVPMIGFVSFG